MLFDLVGGTVLSAVLLNQSPRRTIKEQYGAQSVTFKTRYKNQSPSTVIKDPTEILRVRVFHVPW